MSSKKTLKRMNPKQMDSDKTDPIKQMEETRSMNRASGFTSSYLLSFVALGCLALTPALSAQDATSRPASQPTTEGVESSCTELARRVLAGVSRVPESVRNLPPQKLEEVQRDVDEAIVAANQYLKQCPKATEREQVLVGLGKLLVLNNQRVLTQHIKDYQDANNKKSPDAVWIGEKRKQYFQQVFAVLTEAERTRDEDLAGEIERLKAKCHYYVGDFAKAAETYAAAIKSHPLDPAPDETLCALAGSYLKAGTQAAGALQDSSRFFEGVLTHSQDFVRRYPTSRFLPHILHMEMKAYVGLGRTDDGLKFLQKYVDMHHKVVGGEAIVIDGQRHMFSATTRSEFEVYLDQYEFHLGFMHYVNGNILEAQSHMQRQVDFLTEKGKTKTLGPSSRVYLNRTNEVLETMKELQGKPAPALELGKDSWVNDQELSLEAERGQVVALLFAAYGTPRYDPFSRALETYYQAKWGEGFRAAWVTFRKGPRDIEEQKRDVDAQRRRLGLSYPAGVDCSDQFAASRGFNASVGGANFIVLDRQGNVAWFKIDPTERDLAVAARVVDRLLSEK
ncbi:MAG: hypothetical protein AAF581_06500 [Planctomycetota bacterium]